MLLQGARVWIPHAEHVWEGAEVVEDYTSGSLNVKTEDGKVSWLPEWVSYGFCNSTQVQDGLEIIHTFFRIETFEIYKAIFVCCSDLFFSFIKIKKICSKYKIIACPKSSILNSIKFKIQMDILAFLLIYFAIQLQSNLKGMKLFIKL